MRHEKWEAHSGNQRAKEYFSRGKHIKWLMQLSWSSGCAPWGRPVQIPEE